MEEKGSQDGSKPSLSATNVHRLYFKGLIREETRGLVAGFGVAICGKEDNILFQMKGSIHDSEITGLEAELMALKRGLTEAVSFGITHISIYCDNYQLFELVMERSAPEKDNIALLMKDVQRIRQQLTSSSPLLVTRDNQTNKFAYNLALETLVSEVSIHMPPSHKKKNTFCGICFHDDFEDEQMFSTLCGHQFCVDCLKGHIQVELTRRVPRCPRYGCKSNLTIEICAHLLTPKRRAMWEQRNVEKAETDEIEAMCPKCQQMSVVRYGQVDCRCGYSFCYICGTELKLLGAGCIHRNKKICTLIIICLTFIGSFYCILLILSLLSH